MLVLAIDTATKIGSVALFDDEIGVIGELSLLVKTNHSAVIMSMIDTLFKMSNLTIADVDRVAVTIGPGSFTGIRIGVAIAKGLCYGSNKTLVGVNELELLAHNIEGFSGKIVPMIDARKERVYFSVFENYPTFRRLKHYKDGDLQEVLESLKGEDLYFCGDGAISYRDMITKILGDEVKIASYSNSIPRALVAGEIACKKECSDLYLLEPFYVNKSQAEREKEKRESTK